MVTTIQISGSLQKELVTKKVYDKESYEEVIWSLIEDTQEISEQTKKEIELAREEIKVGKVHSLADVKKRLKL